MDTIPTWRLREELRRKAESSIEGRASFERHVGRLSTKPLTTIELSPHEILQLLNDTTPQVAAFDEGYEQAETDHDGPGFRAPTARNNPYQEGQS